MRIAQCFPDVSVLGRAVGFDLGFRQLDGGDPAVPAVALVGENISLTHMRFGCGYHQIGLPPVNRLTFGVPVSGLRDWFGRRYRVSSILPFNHAGGIDAVSERNFEAFTISVDTRYLADMAASYGMSVPSSVYEPGPESIIEASEQSAYLRGLLSRAFLDRDFELNREAEDELAGALLRAALNGSEATDRSSSRLRNLALEKALAYIAERHADDVTLRDICGENNIALRTLNRAFSERFGIGPKAYLKRRKLCAVRKELLRCPPGTLVTDVANHWGFWHLGQFARDYQSLFGELPSQTMNQ